jgi:aminopeptidase N
VKYLTFIAGKFTKFLDNGGPSSPELQGFASMDVRIMRRGLLEEARTILENYEKWFGAYPYEKLSVIQRLWPTSGGHSPASFVILNELPRTLESPSTVNADSPVDLSRWKEYFIAHEIAHQWWGQAVTGERYHDQRLREGLAQFAAVYYLKAKLGERVYAGILKKFSQWTKKKSPWGPITLGSRLSYLDFIAYQAVVYNKSAVVLNMLLDLLGEETFFRGLQEFYKTYKYRSARTTHFIRTMEQASGRNLKPFFDGWFDSHRLPEVYVTHNVQKQDKDFVLKFKVSQPKDVFVFPLWVEWEENGEKVRNKLEVGSAAQEYEFRTVVRPAKVRINPDKFVPGDFK